MRGDRVKSALTTALGGTTETSQEISCVDGLNGLRAGC